MPNIKSAEKRVKVTAVKKLNNQIVRSRMNTAVKKFNAAIAENNVALAEELLPATSSMIDNAAVHHVIHKNAANHKKAQIAKALYQLKNGIVVVKMDKKSLKQAEQKAAAERRRAEGEAIAAERRAARKAKEARKAEETAAADKKAKK